MPSKGMEKVPQGFAGDLAAMSGITAAIARGIRTTTASAALRRRLRRLAISIEGTAEAVAKEAGLSRATRQVGVELAVAAAENRFCSGSRAGEPGPAFSVARGAVLDAMLHGGEVPR